MTPSNLQRIGRLTPLAEVAAKLKAMAKSVVPVELKPDESAGLTLADDFVSPRSIPDAAVALRDGWAVRAEALEGAGAYAPLPLDPAPAWVNAGDKLPAGADSIAPFDAIAVKGELAQALAPVFPGENVLQAGDYLREGAILRAKGTRLRATDVAAAALAGIAKVRVRRPRIALLQGGERDGAATLGFLARAIAGEGAGAEIAKMPFEKFLTANFDGDAAIAVGGTGSGTNDSTITALASHGKLAVHGVAIAPGETSALGEIQGKPVLLFPGRFDAVLAAWLLLGRELVTALSGSSEREAVTRMALAKKIASAPGIAEVVPLRREGDKAIPLASGMLSLEALAHADGWVLVPPESEGFAEGTIVEMRALP